MTDEEKAEEYADKILFDSKYPFIFNKEKVKAYIIKVYLDSLKCCEEAYNKGLAEGRKELEEKISFLLSCKNCPENKGGFICVKEYENKCLSQKIVYIKELKKEKSKLLGIIRDKDKVIQELEKENAELTCQMKRNTFCYSCKNATERCYKKEIGCPCENYESYKKEKSH